MDDYHSFLAARILGESQNVSYRLLSREMKVCSNTAKQMLYAFHESQNKRKPGSVAACFIVQGVAQSHLGLLEKPSSDSVEDVQMHSSPIQETLSSDHQQEQRWHGQHMLLVSESDIPDINASLERIDSIHIYSLGPGSDPLKNLETLSDCNRAITKKFLHEDPLKHNGIYGTIQNPNVRRRSGIQPPKASSLSAESEVHSTKPSTHAKTSAQISRKAPSSSNSTRDTVFQSSLTKRKEGKSQLFDRQIMSDGQNTKMKDPDPLKPLAQGEGEAKQQTASSAKAPPAQRLTDSSEEEEEAEDFAPVQPQFRAEGENSRAERAEALRKMMEDDDVEMKDLPPEPTRGVPGSEKIDNEQVATHAPEEQQTNTGQEHRRGRRKVMKKKTIKDEEGYLVTKEEPVWESFSEDEPAPSAERPVLPNSSTTKEKKPAKKPEQGNIASFFGKK